MAHDMSVPKGDRDDDIDSLLDRLPADAADLAEKVLKKACLTTVEIVSPKACWANAELHGWHDPAADLTTDLLLIHSEISEACEALRKGNYTMSSGSDSVEEELADAVIRIFHTCQKNNFDIVRAVAIKHQKNMERPFRHGNKRF